MKSLSILILFFSFSLTAFAQADSNGFTNKAEAKNETINGVKEGKWFEYLLDDVSLAKDSTKAMFYRLATYKDGKIYGIARAYYLNGKLECEVPYVNNNRNGIAKYYRPSGRVSLEIPLTNGNQVNGVEKFYDTAGVLEMDITYAKGKMNGTDHIYYPDGKIRSDWTCINGKRTGVQKAYYPDGKIRAETVWKKNKAIAATTYDKNGNVIPDKMEHTN